MLFNSYIFIFCFLPITLIVYYSLSAGGYWRGAMSWLVIASLFFYMWWNPMYIVLIIASVVINYLISLLLLKYSSDTAAYSIKKIILVIGLSFNIGLLGYFKYANFFVDSINAAFGSGFNVEKIILPLAISFFTFQQIAFLVDTYRGNVGWRGFIKFSLFVTFFPQLIAGPIVKHDETIPQFSDKSTSRFKHENLAVGISIFALGLFKKAFLADGIAPFSTLVFDTAASGVPLTFFEAWSGALAYTFQLYFDFSGYSDMAIGLGRMFGIQLPINFNSPYKAANIADFWRRWHMTLSRFLRDYIYIPLGGNRKGPSRRHVNVMITMLLGGLWHGAGWTFVIWGGLHGAFIVAQRAWEVYRNKKQGAADVKDAKLWSRKLSQAVTFIAVVSAWVFFRADNVNTALSMIKSMAGFNGLYAPEWLYTLMMPWRFISNRIFRIEGVYWIIALSMITWLLPNTQQFMRDHKPGLNFDGEKSWKFLSFLKWRPGIHWAVITGLIFLLALLKLNRYSEFLYFNF